MSKTEAPAAPAKAPADSIVNRERIPVEFTNGKSGIVILRRLTIRELREFANAIYENEMFKIVALAADQEEEWVDQLTDESFNRLQQKVHEENFPRAMAMAPSNPAIAAKLAPVIRGAADAMKSRAEIGKHLKGRLPERAPSESAEGNGSESSTSPQPGSDSSSASTTD